MASEQNQSFLTSWELIDVKPARGGQTERVVPSSPTKHTPSDEIAALPDGETAPPATKSSPSSLKSLCGFLSKKEGRGIIKTWRTRWFVLDDTRCVLFYYRSQQDFVPLGHIDISVASLSFDLENVDKGQFEIKSEDKVFYLQADSRQAMMYWLNALQAKRKASSRLRRIMELENSQAKDEYCGLANVPNVKVHQTLEERMTVMKPSASQDMESAPGAAPPPKTVDWSLSTLKEEFRTVGKRMTTTGTGQPPRPVNSPQQLEIKAKYSRGLEDSSEAIALDSHLTGEHVSPSAIRVASVEADRTVGSSPTSSRTSSDIIRAQPVATLAPSQQSAKLSDSPPIRPSAPSTTTSSPETTQSSSGGLRAGLSKSRLGTLFNPVRRNTKEKELEIEKQPPPATQSVFHAPVTAPSCQRCIAHDQRISALSEEVEILEKEIGARQRLIQDFHQQLMATKTMLRSNDQFIASPDEESRVKLLCDKDMEIAKLQGELVQRKEASERDDVLLVKLRREISNLTEECKLYKETLVAKDEVVVALSNELAQAKTGRQGFLPISTSAPPVQDLLGDDFGSGGGGGLLPQTSASASTIAELQESVEKLRDTVGAFQLQNDFLNTEIVELDQLRQDDQKLIVTQESKIVEMEAAYLKLHSNHLVILQEMQKPQVGGMQLDQDAGNTQEMVARLLEDAMETDVTAGLDINPLKQEDDDAFDRYGFKKNAQSVSAKATTLLRRGNELEMLEGGHRARWEAYMKNRAATRRFEFTNEVKALTRQGIPAEFRTEVWRDLIYARVQGMMQNKGAGYYQSLHQMSDSKGSLVYKQIELDLLRTLPGNKYYNRPDAPGVPRLRRLLRAFAWHNPVIGYCQGLNRLAAIALLVLNEEDAFWGLVLIVDFLMPKSYYSKTLMASQVDQRVLKDLMAMKCPRLAAHLDSHCIDIGLITFNWFLTIFVDNVPFETVLLIWDSFLYEGCKILFRFALGVFKLNEDDLLQLTDTSQIFQRMREMASSISDNRALSQASFPGLNPFPMRVINRQRALHTTIVKEELAEMESIRNTHQELTFESQRNDPAMIVFSDDDDN